nr:internal virion protein B-like protein [uncultured Mediterranean phage uvMED]BAR37693.1 internal virion protein B-like protein [uncultured Mediterranean phage uvMED]
MAFAAPAVPYIVGGTALLGMKQADTLGKFNQSVDNRNALVKEQEKTILDDKLNIDLAKFYKAFEKLEGSTNVALAKSGVDPSSGTASNIKLSNLYERELETQMMKYNTEIGKARKDEEANFARIKGQMARMSSRMEQFRIASSVGSSLLTMTG